MGNKLYEENSISAIASAIRSKLNTETLYKVNEMAGAINSIPKASGTTNIVENGYHDVTAYAQAYVNVPGSVPTGKINITENGTNIDIAQYATADVQVPQPIGKTTITQNGTDINIAQYAVADVQVPQPSYIMKPIEFDYDIGSVTIHNGVGTWTYNDEGVRRSDIYEVEEGKRYRIQLGTIYGNRFRGIVTDTDVRTLTQGDSISGQGIGTNSTVTSYTSSTFTAEVTGYLVIFKDAANTDGILTYMFDYEEM